MILNEVGRIVETIWDEIPVHFTFVRLGEFVVMPNHIHGIIQINKTGKTIDTDINGKDAINRVSTSENDKQSDSIGIDTHRRDAINHVSMMGVDTEEINPNEIKKKGGITGNNNPMLHQNLSRILRWYKGRVTFEARKINPDFSWQTRFHDRIIRDKNEWYAKTNYIKNNPENWREDEFNIDGLWKIIVLRW